MPDGVTTSVICSACSGPFILDELVVRCPTCGAQYHPDCWERHRGCTAPTCAARANGRHPGDPAAGIRERITADHLSRCHRCGQCTVEPARRYYYGRRFREWPDLISHYDIAGESELQLCVRCAHAMPQVKRIRIMSALFQSLMVAGYAAYIPLTIRSDWPRSLNVLSVGIAVTFAISWVMGVIHQFRDTPFTREAAFRMAVHRTIGDHWRAQGYNAILLPEEYERLVAQDRVRRVPGTGPSVAP